MKFWIILLLLTLPVDSYTQQFSQREFIGNVGYSSGKKLRLLHYNNDGYLDILAYPFVHINDGNGNRASTVQISDRPRVKNLKVADFNQDGRDDLVIMQENSEVTVFMNSKKGLNEVKQDVKLKFFDPDYAEMYIADINGDQNLDIIINRFQNFSAFAGDGKGHFAKFKAFNEAFKQEGFILSKDVDGDGIDEVLSLDSYSETEKRMPAIKISKYKDGAYVDVIRYKMETASTECFFAKDLDNDGDEDLIFSGEYANGIYWSECDSDGGYTQLHKIETENKPLSFSLGDLDGDGDIDIIKNTVSISHEPSNNYWIENLGQGNFSEEKMMEPPYDFGYLITADMNNDQKADLMQLGGANGRCISVELNMENGFNAPINWITSGVVRDFEFMDVNNDEITDIVAIRADRLFYYLVSEDGINANEIELARNEVPMSRIQLLDLDNDGLLDIFWKGEKDRINHVGWYKNLGTGDFELQKIELIEDRVKTAKFIDYDQDNDLDLITYELGINKNYGFYVYKNNGSGKFDETRIKIIASDQSKTLFIFDANLDGLPDIVDMGKVCQYYTHVGGDKFSNTTIAFIAGSNRFSRNLLFVDLDNDTHKDILMDIGGKLSWSKVDKKKNAAVAEPIDKEMRAKGIIITGDIDNDGDNDIVCRTEEYVLADFDEEPTFQNKYKLVWLENDGNGLFSVHYIGPSTGFAEEIKLFDIDGDKDLDLFHYSSIETSGGLCIYRNNQM